MAALLRFALLACVVCGILFKTKRQSRITNHLIDVENDVFGDKVFCVFFCKSQFVPSNDVVNKWQYIQIQLFDCQILRGGYVIDLWTYVIRFVGVYRIHSGRNGLIFEAALQGTRFSQWMWCDIEMLYEFTLNFVGTRKDWEKFGLTANAHTHHTYTLMQGTNASTCFGLYDQMGLL